MNLLRKISYAFFFMALLGGLNLWWCQKYKEEIQKEVYASAISVLEYQMSLSISFLDLAKRRKNDEDIFIYKCNFAAYYVSMNHLFQMAEKNKEIEWSKTHYLDSVLSYRQIVKNEFGSEDPTIYLAKKCSDGIWRGFKTSETPDILDLPN